ncbi:MAG: hypothetical protein JNK73_04695 [Bacteroidia bacterium]|nr:hypothetical protein [Bacteroidia bacterium]
MKSALASIGKNLILIGVLFFSALNYFAPSYSWKEIVSAQILAGLAYVFLGCYEYLNASYKASLPIQRYPYFTSSFFMFRALKVGVFLSFAILLLLSGSKVQYLAPICFIIAGTEMVITVLKFRKGLCFVNIYANYILILQQRAMKVFASELMIVEFRHGIFYFIKKNHKSLQINLEHIHEKDHFLQSIHTWIVRNHVMLSEESRHKIEELITH